MQTRTQETTRPEAGTGPRHSAKEKSLPKQVLARIKEDQASVLASAIAFWGFLSIFPALIAAMTVYGLVADPSQVQSTVSNLFGNFSSDAQSLVSRTLEGVASGGSALTWGLLLSLLGLVWTSSSVTSYLLRASSLVAEQEPRSSIKARLLSIPLTLVFLVVVAVAIGVVAVLPAVLSAVDISGVARVGATAAGYVVMLLLLIGTGTLLYSKGPAEGGPSTKHSAIGAAVAAGLWLVASLAFSLYVSNFGSYDATYGSIGGIIVVLLWFYLSAFSIVLGMIVASVLGRRASSSSAYP